MQIPTESLTELTSVMAATISFRCFLTNSILDSSHLMSNTHQQDRICSRHPWKWRQADTSREEGPPERARGKVSISLVFKCRRAFFYHSYVPCRITDVLLQQFPFLSCIPTKRHFCASFFIVLLFPLIQYLLNDCHSMKMGQQCSVKLLPSSCHQLALCTAEYYVRH